MKKTFTKILSVVLCAVMVLGAAPLGGFVGLDLPQLFDFKAEAATYSGTCGDNLTWSLDTSTGVLNITGTGEMYNYSENRPWTSYSSHIKTVNIANGVTSICDYAFVSCDNLTSLTIGTSLSTIGNNALCFCFALTSITVDANNKDYSSDSDGVLFNKNKTTLVQYPIGNTRKSYTIPDSVITIENDAFAQCENLISVTIPDSVTTICDSALSCCYNLTSLTIPDSVTTIGDYAFNRCDSLASIIIPDSVITIGDNAFQGCYTLTNINIPNSVETIGESAFGWCDNLKSITVSANNKNYSSDSDGVLFNKDKTTLLQYPCGNVKTNYTVPDSVTRIDDFALEACNNLINVTIPDSVRNIDYYAFGFCDNLTSVTIGNGVNIINNNAFAYCSALTSITIGTGVTAIGGSAFYGCNILQDVYYDGIEAQWNKIYIASDNDELTNANIHFKDIYNDAVVPAPSQTTIKYGDSIILHVDPAKVPESGYVEWYASNDNFTFNVSEGGTTCTIKPSVSGSTTFTATVYDQDGRPISTDEQTMTSKAGFFNKLIAFFKSIFGLTKIYEY